MSYECLICNFNGELQEGSQGGGGGKGAEKKRYKDTLKASLKRVEQPNKPTKVFMNQHPGHSNIFEGTTVVQVSCLVSARLFSFEALLGVSWCLVEGYL